MLISRAVNTLSNVRRQTFESYCVPGFEIKFAELSVIILEPFTNPEMKPRGHDTEVAEIRRKVSICEQMAFPRCVLPTTVIKFKSETRFRIDNKWM